MIRPSVAVSLTLALGAVLAGCGGHVRSAAPQAAQVTKAFEGSPPPLAMLHSQANRLLGGGVGAFKALMANLRGYPVVVNKWASWCGPCKFEFPAFQRAAVAFGRRVAFVGLDGTDQNDAAASFLRTFRVTYPSYVDPHEDIARAIEALGPYPQTVYYDRRGKFVYNHAGQYKDGAALERDIQRYALR